MAPNEKSVPTKYIHLLFQEVNGMSIIENNLKNVGR